MVRLTYIAPRLRIGFSDAVVTDRAAVQPRRQQDHPTHADFDLSR